MHHEQTQLGSQWIVCLRFFLYCVCLFVFFLLVLTFSCFSLVLLTGLREINKLESEEVSQRYGKYYPSRSTFSSIATSIAFNDTSPVPQFPVRMFVGGYFEEGLYARQLGNVAQMTLASETAEPTTYFQSLHSGLDNLVCDSFFF